MAVRLPSQVAGSINSPKHVLLRGTKVDCPGINENMITTK